MKSKADAMKDVGEVLDQKVTIEQLTGTSKDDFQNDVEDWEEVQTVWGKVLALFGQEYYAAKAVNEEKTLKFKLRRTALTSALSTDGHRLIYLEDAYDIKHVDFLPGGLWIIVKALKRG